MLEAVELAIHDLDSRHALTATDKPAGVMQGIMRPACAAATYMQINAPTQIHAHG